MSRSLETLIKDFYKRIALTYNIHNMLIMYTTFDRIVTKESYNVQNIFMSYVMYVLTACQKENRTKKWLLLWQ